MIIHVLLFTHSETCYAVSQVCLLVQDYESRITTLQEQLERHSVISSLTYDDYENEFEETFGKKLKLTSLIRNPLNY